MPYYYPLPQKPTIWESLMKAFSRYMEMSQAKQSWEERKENRRRQEEESQLQEQWSRKLLEGLQPRPAELAEPVLGAERVPAHLLGAKPMLATDIAPRPAAMFPPSNVDPLSRLGQAPMTVGPKPMSPLGQPQRFPSPMTTTQPDFRQALLQAFTQYPQMLGQVPGAMNLLQPPQAQPFEPQWFGTPGAGIYATTPKGGLEQKLAAPRPVPGEPPDLEIREELVDGVPTYVYRHPKTAEIVKIGGLVPPGSRGTSGKTPVSQELEARQEQLRKKGEELRAILETPQRLQKRAAELFPDDKDKLAKTLAKITADLKQVEADSLKTLQGRKRIKGEEAGDMGEPNPDLSVKDKDGNEYSLQEIKDKWYPDSSLSEVYADLQAKGWIE